MYKEKQYEHNLTPLVSSILGFSRGPRLIRTISFFVGPPACTTGSLRLARLSQVLPLSTEVCGRGIPKGRLAGSAHAGCALAARLVLGRGARSSAVASSGSRSG